MFSNDKNVETIAQLIEVLKHYIGLQSEYVKLDVIEKVVRLLTVITLVVVFCIILLISFIYLSFAAVYALQPLVGSLALAFLIVIGFYLLLLVILRESFNVKIEIMIEQTTRYKSLNDIRLRKAQLRSDIIKDSNKIAGLWNELVHKPKDNSTPTKRFSGMITTGAGVLDGAILGWKLYRKLGGKQPSPLKGLKIFRKKG